MTLSTGAIEVINVTRSYATGESFFSKGVKAAIIDLQRYAEDGDPASYAQFLKELAVPAGDIEARRSLEAGRAGDTAARAGLEQGRNARADIPGLIRVFHWLGSWRPMAQAIDDWRQADPLVEGLARDGAALHALMNGRAESPDGPQRGLDRRQLLAEIAGHDRQLTVLEDNFATHVGNAARAARSLVVVALLLSSLVLWALGFILAWRIYGRGVSAELQARRSEERFRDIADVASDWFWETDAALRITYLSERFADATRVPREEVLGRLATEIVAPDNREAEEWRAVRARGPFRGRPYRYHRSDGSTAYWSLSGKPIFDPEGTFAGYRGSGSEVTAAVHADAALKAAKVQADLARAQAVAANRAKSEFLANMSHELRTPLNAILGFSELIQSEIHGPIGSPRYREYVGDVLDAGQHLLQVITDILDLSKVEAGRVELDEAVLDLRAAFAAAKLLVKERLHQKEQKFTTEIADDLPALRADPVRLRQMLINLLTNAIKFTPCGGRLCLGAALRADGAMQIVVRDTGIGIAPSDIPTALAPFGQVENGLDRRYEGTGLGLPLTRKLVELHQGEIHIESAVGAGTTVTLVFPSERVVRRRPDEPQAEEAAEASEGSRPPAACDLDRAEQPGRARPQPAVQR